MLHAIDRVLAPVLEPIGRINNTIVLGVLFFLVLTPLGWLLRLSRRGRVERRARRGAATYWKPRAPEDSEVDFRRIY